MIPPFEIKLLSISWVKDDGKDDPKDLCAHGNVFLRIGNEILSDKDRRWTVSSTALHLMRTIFQDYNAGDYYSQLLPCCGHGFYPSPDGKTVTLGGCPNGINWTIEHLKNGDIKHSTWNETEVIVPPDEYATIIFRFATEVETFYENSQSKDLSGDLERQNGYLAFWREWRALKAKIANQLG